MDIPFRAAQAGGDFQDRDPGGGIDVAAAAGKHLAVARSLRERRDPADLEIEAVDDQQIGGAHLDDVGRLRVDEVGVLHAAGDDRQVDPVAADVARDGAEVRQRRDDLHGRGGERRGGNQRSDDEEKTERQRHRGLSTCGRRARR
jgi:hypothetical protein